MKNILGIVGSPRQLGNCELIIKEISQRISEKHQLKLLRLSDFEVKLCRGCFKCLFGKQRCSLEDDIYLIGDAISEANALILAVPTYALSANSSLKILLDRCLTFYSYNEKIWNKPAIGIVIAGIPGKEGSALLDVERFLHVILADIKKTAVLYGALPGEILLEKDNLETAGKLAKALFDSTPEKKKFSCSVCGGDTFRFLGGDKVKCLLCSNNGIVQFDGGEPFFLIEKDSHGMFLSEDKARQHLEWLRSQREKYFKIRHKLKDIKSSYSGDWLWITPKNAK